MAVIFLLCRRGSAASCAPSVFVHTRAPRGAGGLGGSALWLYRSGHRASSQQTAAQATFPNVWWLTPLKDYNACCPDWQLERLQDFALRQSVKKAASAPPGGHLLLRPPVQSDCMKGQGTHGRGGVLIFHLFPLSNTLALLFVVTEPWVTEASSRDENFRRVVMKTSACPGWCWLTWQVTRQGSASSDSWNKDEMLLSFVQVRAPLHRGLHQQQQRLLLHLPIYVMV